MAPQPNIVLITVDSLRPDHLGCYGYGRRTSPHIDALAAGGCLFETAWASGPSTPFSFPGLMASVMPFQCSEFGLAAAPQCLAEVLSRGGYRTRGLAAANPYVSDFFGYGRGFGELRDFMEYFPARHRLFRYFQPGPGVGSKAGVRQPARPLPGPAARVRGRLRRMALTGWAMRLAARLRDGADARLKLHGKLRVKREMEEAFHKAVADWAGNAGRQPFFLWVHAMTPHVPLAPLRRCQRAVAGRAVTTARLNALALKAAALNRGDSVELSRAELQSLVDLYDAEVRRADELVGRVMARLAEAGLEDSTAVVVTADHGEQFMEHGRLVHPSVHYNELLRVPLVVRLPGGARGARVQTSVGLVDLLPTLAELAGCPLDAAACAGRSLAALLRDPQAGAGPERVFVSESCYGPRDTLDGIDWHRPWAAPRRVSFQTRVLKLMVDCTAGTAAAFDLTCDPAERHDLSADRPELCSIALRLARLHQRRQERARIAHRLARLTCEVPGRG